MRALRSFAPLALAAALAALAALAGGCAASGAFSMSSDDNNAAALKQAFATEARPTPDQPANASGKPMAFLVTATPRKLVAWSFASEKAAWSVDADITSRVVVGSKLVAAREGKDKIVARSTDDGHVLWSATLPPKSTFLGAAADGERVFYVLEDKTGAKPVWYLIALGDGGQELWRSAAPGTLGAPAARGGLVYLPFLTQWLTILDARTGAQLARIRQTDEAVSFVRTTSDGVFYGSKGIFLLDDRSVAGTKEGATYGQAKLPGEFVRTVYHFDAFNPIMAGYSAFDRNRVLWRASGEGGKLSFRDGLATVFSFRFFFAFDAASGELRWAHQHPRYDIVSVEHTGTSIFYVSVEGEIGALDPKTGARLFEKKLGMRVTGATFDADGWKPTGAAASDAAAAGTVSALSAILVDKDTRFGAVKLFAVASLGKLPGVAASEALLKVIMDEATPAPVYNKAAEMLVARKDADVLPALTKALDVQYDFITGAKPRALDVLARAIGAIGKPVGAAALLPHLESPATPPGALRDIAAALGACGSKDAIPALRSFLLVYRADPTYAADGGPLVAVIEALLALGGGAERELVQFVAYDARTQSGVAEYAKYALQQTGPHGAGGQPRPDAQAPGGK
jgi:outer membrane protein assembly factor BamB